MKSALVFWGGWEGHEPEKVALRFAGMLDEAGYAVEVYNGKDCLADGEKLKGYDLIVPSWTMGTIDGQLVKNVSEAVAAGTGLAGCHGGMCDAFRESTDWQFMTGSQWVAHPGGGGVTYTVNVRKGSSPIVEGIEDFTVTSEQYYLHVDPAVEVLAATRFPSVAANKPVDMPVAYTKFWGLGRVFYLSLGHHADVFDIPEAGLLMRRGLIWAAEGKAYAETHKPSADDFLSGEKPI